MSFATPSTPTWHWRSHPRETAMLGLLGCAAALAIATVSIAGAVAGAGAYRSYPTIELGTGASTLALAVALPLLAAVPFAADRLRLRRG